MKKRDYASLLHRLQAVGPTQLVAECGGYPIYVIELGSGTEVRILLTAGLHGDEPAGPEAALRFAHHTEHALISETPSEWPLAVRAEAHLRALEVVLQRRLGA